jgi:hypothetical protein
LGHDPVPHQPISVFAIEFTPLGKAAKADGQNHQNAKTGKSRYEKKWIIYHFVPHELKLSKTVLVYKEPGLRQLALFDHPIQQ